MSAFGGRGSLSAFEEEEEVAVEEEEEEDMLLEGSSACDINDQRKISGGQLRTGDWLFRPLISLCTHILPH